MTAILPLMKNILTPLAINILLPVELSPGMFTATQKKRLWIRSYSINNLKWTNERYNDNSSIAWTIRIIDKKDCWNN